MIHSMLVPVDGSPASLHAARFGARLAQVLGATLRGLHVIDTRLLDGPFVMDVVAAMGLGTIQNRRPALEQLLKERAAAALTALGAVAAEEGVAIAVEQVQGLAERVIAQRAQSVDLVVMGRQGENEAFRGGQLGATAESVVRRSPAPVLLVGSSAGVISLPMVAYDGSERSHRALTLAAQVAEQLALAIAVVTVADTRDEGERLARPAIDYLNATHVAFEAHVRLGGDVAVELAAAARQLGADLVLLGATGHGRLLRRLLGSVTEELLESLELPVLAVR